MAGLTIYEALLGELESYSPSSITLRKALADVGLNDSTKEYNPNTDKKAVCKAAIKVLRQLIVLSSDSQGKSAQSYNNKVESRIKQLCAEIGEDVSLYLDVPTIEDGSNLW